MANGHNPAIQLSFEYSSLQVSFLDVLVKVENGKIITDLYRKPTDTLQYLKFDSCHPTEHKLPIAYSQALRINKICSRKSDAVGHCAVLKKALIHRGYPRKMCSNYIKRALDMNREMLIWPVFGPPNKPPVRMIIPYHPDVAHIPDIVRSQSDLLGGLNIPIKVFWKPPKQIRKNLVRSFLEPSAARNRIDKPRLGRGTERCNRPRCKCCAMVKEGTQAVSSKSGLTYNLPFATCATEVVIYLLSFRNCPKQYIGQTKQSLSKRMNLYRSRFGKQEVDQPAVHHMISHNHDWADLRVQVLQVVGDPDKLWQTENHWISQMMTDLPHGLNVQNVLYRNICKQEEMNFRLARAEGLPCIRPEQ